MGTYSFTGYKVTEDGSGNAIAIETATFDLVFDNDSQPLMEYSILSTPTGELPVIESSATNDNLYDGNFSGQSFNDPSTSDINDGEGFGEVTWDNGGGLKTSYVYGFWDDSENTSYLFVLWGDQVPTFNTTSDYNNFLAGAVQSIGVAGSPYSDSDTLDVSTGIGVSSDDDLINGTNGDDEYNTGAGNDTVYANEGDDILRGQEGNDHLDGGPGFDELVGEAGNDTLDGGGTDERDVIDYTSAPSGVDVDLAAGTADDGFGTTDTIIDVAQVRGSQHADVLTGDGERNQFMGLAGDDTIDGGDGRDRVRYGEEFWWGGTQGVDVDLESGLATDMFGDTDTLISIEDVQGSQFGDTITGDAEGNGIAGKAGNDVIDGGDGNDDIEGGAGNDTIDGGAGDRDRLNYDGADGTFAVNVDLSGGTAIDTFGDTDTISNVENVRGTQLGDTIVGDANENQLLGEDGDDELSGGAGRDWLEGGAGNDTIDGGDNPENQGDELLLFGEIDDYTFTDNMDGTITVTDNVGGDGVDLVSNIEHIWFHGSQTGMSMEAALAGVTEGDDFLDFTGTTEYIEVDGLGGNDTITGGSGELRAWGSEGDDHLIGGSYRNSLYGGDGNDSMEATNASDDSFFYPGAGNDTMVGNDQGYDNVGYDNDDENPGNGIVVTATGERSGTIIDWNGDTDVYTDIPNIRGTAYDDEYYGNEFRDHFRAWIGNDYFDGAGGRDEIDYHINSYHDEAYTGVFVDLDDGSGTDGNIQGFGNDGYGTVDTLVNVEDVRGTAANDTIHGSEEDNSLQGAEGNDALYGYGGNDWFHGGEGNDTIDGGAEDDSWGDVATYEGNFEDFTITDNMDGTFTVADNNTSDGDEGTDLLEDIEQIQFWGSNHSIGIDSILYGVTEEADSIDASGADEGVNLNALGGDDTIIGTNFGDRLEGGDGNDNIQSLLGGDVIVGGAGNDTLTGSNSDSDDDWNYFEPGPGDDLVDGGTGEAWNGVDYHWGEPPTQGIVATYSDGNNAIVLDGWGGTDTLIGIDAIRGTNFNDVMTGHDGEQSFSPNGGNDTIDGGAGDDWLSFDRTANKGASQGAVVNFATDTFIDTFGDTNTVSNIEMVWGSEWGDDVTGVDGMNHTFVGNDGNDTLTGADGDDTLRDGAGDDLVIGGAGDDVFEIGTGDDTWHGGEGWDLLTRTIDDPFTGDVLVWDLSTGTSYVDSDPTHPLGDDFTGIEAIDIQGAPDIRLVGDDNDNALTTGDGDDTILGGGGNDTLQGGRGTDSVDGGDGDDTILNAGGANDIFNGGAGNDTLIDDVTEIATSEGYFGTVNLDTGAHGANTQDPGDWDTILNIENAIWHGLADQRVEMTGTNGANMLQGGDGDDTIMGLGGADYLIGGLGNDIIDGGDGNDSVVGGLGDDVLNGGAGNDTIVSGSGADAFDGGDGFDTFAVSVAAEHGAFVGYVDLENGVVHPKGEPEHALADTITNIEAVNVDALIDFHVIGDAGGNVVVTDEGNDTLEGGAGNDTLQGGAGDDTLDGGDGIDTAIYATDAAGLGLIDNMDDTYTVTDSFGGTDIVSNVEQFLLNDGIYSLNMLLNGTTNGADVVDESASGDGVEVDSGGGADDVTGSAFADILNLGSGNDNASGGDGNDQIGSSSGDATISGDGGDDVLVSFEGDNSFDGGADNDLIVGGLGDDMLDGGDGNDVLIGDILAGIGGADTLTGGAGDDTLEGGAGPDVFVFAPMDGNDLIASVDDPHAPAVFSADFTPGVDKLDLTAFGYVDAASALALFADDGGSAVLTDVANGFTLRLEDVALADLSTDDLLVL